MEQQAREVAALEIKIYGMVQGVGFRPSIYNLSQRWGLKGWVLNDSQGVTIHWEGAWEDISLALEEVLSSPPPLAKITGHELRNTVPEGHKGFFIKESSAGDDKQVLVSPDVGVCGDCMRELCDPHDRRYEYPFINCTNCGPRFTIIQNVPYDRHLTTMKEFQMCPSCQEEYDDPGTRRFHAQPNACPDCGPQLSIWDRFGQQVDKTYEELLEEGAVIALKGLGGFHLACDAFNQEAVSRLRNSKLRDAKPFALMASNMDIVKKYCSVSPCEEKYLVSPARPIVILQQKKESEEDIPEEVNPDLDTLGMMLPYTPLHWLFFSEEFSLLVMTSANIASNPLITDNEEALEELKDIADYFILHNREIENPCDDSVGMVVEENWLPVRRARGFVPLPVQLKNDTLTPLLACGGNLKNTFALAAGSNVFLSQHLGDLDNYLNFKVYDKTIYRMMDLIDIEPQLIVHDKHPDYQTTLYAKEIAEKMNLPLVDVQHHHSHMASCMAENGLKERVLAVICDGTGYGTDGTVWGFEFLCGDYSSFERLGHLETVPILGGEEAIRRPARMTFSFLASLLGEAGVRYAGRWLSSLNSKELEVLDVQLKREVNSIPTSSCGRLFDAAAALMGICLENKYEGQAPMEMEAAARNRGGENDCYSLKLKEGKASSFQLTTVSLWEALLDDLEKGSDVRNMAYKFHVGLAKAVKDGALYMAESTGVDKVVLSGGVFQNRLLIELAVDLLKKEGLRVYCHNEVPPNDGGISLGQAVVGNEVKKNVLSSTA